MKRLALVLTAAAGLIVSSHTPARAQSDEWVAQVRRQLQAAGHRLEGSGYSMTHEIFTGSLNNGANEFVAVPLDIGMSYELIGTCDTDCSDLDLVLFDPDGNQVDSDVQLDDVPIVSVSPRRSGTYRVKVIMAKCTAEPCRYGIGVFGK